MACDACGRCGRDDDVVACVHVGGFGGLELEGGWGGEGWMVGFRGVVACIICVTPVTCSRGWSTKRNEKWVVDEGEKNGWESVPWKFVMLALGPCLVDFLFF